MKLDLAAVQRLLEDALDTVEEMDGLNVDDGDWVGQAPNQEARRRRTELARQTRVILVLADRLALAEALVRNQYWLAKGEVDALFHQPPA